MSELKAYMLYTPREGVVAGFRTSGSIRIEEGAEIYLKSEADKVIEEKDKELRHHKYKRCLAMAEMCKARYDEEDAKVNGCGASWEYISKEMKYWERWQWRWLELAENFKEAK